MSNLQKFSKHTFLKIFILGALFSVQAVYSQNRDQLPHQDAVNEALKLEETIFTKPLKESWNFPDQNIKTINIASDNVHEILLSTFNGKILNLNSDNGEKIWESDLGGDTVSVPVVFEDNIYTTTRPVKETINVKEAVNIDDDVETNSKIRLSPAKNNSYLIIRAINKKNGLTKWQTKISSKNAEVQMSFLFVYSDEIIIFDNTGTLNVLNKEDGTIKWSKSFDFTLACPPFLTGDKIIAATSEKQFIFISTVDGETINKFSVPAEISAFFYNTDTKHLIWGSRKGNVSALMLDFKELPTSDSSKKKTKTDWIFRNGAEISKISSTDRGFLISSFDNFLYLVSKEKGSLIWKRRLNGRVAASPLVYKNFVVVTNVAEPTAFVLDLKSGKIINKISLPDGNYFVCSPIFAKNKLILTTQKGVFAFSSNDLKE